MPEAKKRELVELLEKRGVPLIEDDVYAELYFGDERPRPAKAFESKGGVLHCGSFSKSSRAGISAWAGWRRVASRARCRSGRSRHRFPRACRFRMASRCICGRKATTRTSRSCARRWPLSRRRLLASLAEALSERLSRDAAGRWVFRLGGAAARRGRAGGSSFGAGAGHQYRARADFLAAPGVQELRAIELRASLDARAGPSDREARPAGALASGQLERARSAARCGHLSRPAIDCRLLRVRVPFPSPQHLSG